MNGGRGWDPSRSQGTVPLNRSRGLADLRCPDPPQREQEGQERSEQKHEHVFGPSRVHFCRRQPVTGLQRPSCPQAGHALPLEWGPPRGLASKEQRAAHVMDGPQGQHVPHEGDTVLLSPCVLLAVTMPLAVLWVALWRGPLGRDGGPPLANSQGRVRP